MVRHLTFGRAHLVDPGEPEDVGFASIFYELDPVGYDVMFEQFRT